MILIDILKDEHRDFQKILYEGFESNETFVIPTVVFAELLPQFKGDVQPVHAFLKEHKIRIEPLDLESAVAAGTRWLQYLKRKSKIACPQCGHHLSIKEHFLSDFYIGGFALSKCDRILTRDRGIYGKYFPELKGYRNCL